MKILLGIVAGFIALLYLASLSYTPPGAATAAAADDPCPLSSIAVTGIRVQWADPCRGGACTHMKGAGTLVNSCPIAIGVQLKVVGYDGNGIPVASKAAWPASVKNIPPGDYVFSLDHWLDYDPAIERFGVSVESTRVWN